MNKCCKERCRVLGAGVIRSTWVKGYVIVRRVAWVMRQGWLGLLQELRGGGRFLKRPMR